MTAPRGRERKLSLSSFLSENVRRGEAVDQRAPPPSMRASERCIRSKSRKSTHHALAFGTVSQKNVQVLISGGASPPAPSKGAARARSACKCKHTGVWEFRLAHTALISDACGLALFGIHPPLIAIAKLISARFQLLNGVLRIQSHETWCRAQDRVFWYSPPDFYHVPAAAAPDWSNMTKQCTKGLEFEEKDFNNYFLFFICKGQEKVGIHKYEIQL